MTDQHRRKPPERITAPAWLTIDQVLRLVPVTSRKLYRMISAGEFPRSRKLHTIGQNGRAVWRKDEVTAWLANSLRAARETQQRRKLAA